MPKAKSAARPSPLQKPATAAYRATQKNIGHFTEPSSHPASSALSRSGIGATKQVIGVNTSANPTTATSASSVFTRGGASDPAAAKTIASPQMIPATGVSAPSLLSQPTASAGRASS